MRASLIPILLVVGLSACATADASPNRYQRDLERLQDDCRERGGILGPTGKQTGRAQTDNVCQITGGASRIP